MEATWTEEDISGSSALLLDVVTVESLLSGTWEKAEKWDIFFIDKDKYTDFFKPNVFDSISVSEICMSSFMDRSTPWLLRITEILSAFLYQLLIIPYLCS